MASACSFPPVTLIVIPLPDLDALFALLVVDLGIPPIPLPKRPDMHVSIPPLPGGRLSISLPAIPSISALLELALIPISIPPLPFGIDLPTPSVPSLDLLLSLALGFLDIPPIPQPRCFLDDRPE